MYKRQGLENLARTMAVEWAPHIRVNTLVVGMVRTELSHLHYGDEAGLAAVGRTVPLGRLATPDEIGELCAFLAGDRCAYVSGASLTVHGGGERPAFLEAAGRPASPEAAGQPAFPKAAGRPPGAPDPRPPAPPFPSASPPPPPPAAGTGTAATVDPEGSDDR